MVLIWGKREAEYFSADDWTGGIRLIWFKKIVIGRATRHSSKGLPGPDNCDGLRCCLLGNGRERGSERAHLTAPEEKKAADEIGSALRLLICIRLLRFDADPERMSRAEFSRNRFQQLG